jgi:hypothetical protein
MRRYLEFWSEEDGVIGGHTWIAIPFDLIAPCIISEEKSSEQPATALLS